MRVRLTGKTLPVQGERWSMRGGTGDTPASLTQLNSRGTSGYVRPVSPDPLSMSTTRSANDPAPTPTVVNASLRPS